MGKSLILMGSSRTQLLLQLSPPALGLLREDGPPPLRAGDGPPPLLPLCHGRQAEAVQPRSLHCDPLALFLSSGDKGGPWRDQEEEGRFLALESRVTWS